MDEDSSREGRSIDEGISTATLAGIEERPSPARDGNNVASRDYDRSSLDANVFDSANLRGDPQTMNDRQRIDPREDDRAGMRTANSSLPNTNGAAEESAPLFPGGEATELRARWDAIQVGFVDEPRRAVEQADALVAGAMKRLAETFAEERGRLEGQWDRGDSVSTEDLRLALRRYRSFFGRLLSV